MYDYKGRTETVFAKRGVLPTAVRVIALEQLYDSAAQYSVALAVDKDDALAFGLAEFRHLFLKYIKLIF